MDPLFRFGRIERFGYLCLVTMMLTNYYSAKHLNIDNIGCSFLSRNFAFSALLSNEQLRLMKFGEIRYAPGVVVLGRGLVIALQILISSLACKKLW